MTKKGGVGVNGKIRRKIKIYTTLRDNFRIQNFGIAKAGMMGHNRDKQTTAIVKYHLLSCTGNNITLNYTATIYSGTDTDKQT